jgi:hypothetical protein
VGTRLLDNFFTVDLDLVKALKGAFAAYSFNAGVVSIFGGLIYGAIISIFGQAGAEIPGMIIQVAIATAVVYYTSLWYFTGQKAGWENGLLLGLFFVVFSIVVTVFQISITNAFGLGAPVTLGEFFKGAFSSMNLWISVATTALAAAAAGYVKNPRA